MNDRADEANHAQPDDAPDDGHDVSALVLALAHELLENDAVTLDDDFFSAGGDSILAMHLVGQLARRTGLRVRVSLLFANPSLRDFTAEVERLREQKPAQRANAPVGALATALSAARKDTSAS